MVKDKTDNLSEIHSKCGVMVALDIIGGKWRLPIIWQLSAKESMRYNELKRHLDGITNIMLTRALQGLEENGLVKRVELNQIPPHVVYSLTDSCKELLPALSIINEWGKENLLKKYYKECAEEEVALP